MFKIIGAILICSGTATIGFSAANRLSMRIKILNCWLGILDIMHSEIKFLLTPLDELMIKCLVQAEEPVKSFFQSIIQRCRENADVSFGEIWMNALDECEYLGLTGQDKHAVCDLGNTLGKYDANEQAQRIECLRKTIENRVYVAEHEKNNSARLYSSLGVACGIALVIVFI